MGLKYDEEGLEENQMDEVFWCPTLLEKENHHINMVSCQFKMNKTNQNEQKSIFEAPRKTNLLKH